MYVVFGDEILDSQDILDTINENTNFTVEKDLTKSTKREDTLAYKISIDTNILNNILKEHYNLIDLDEESLFDEYMKLCDELSLDILDYIKNDDAIISTRAYKWDNSDNTIKSVVCISHFELGELKLFDITKRILSQVD